MGLAIKLADETRAQLILHHVQSTRSKFTATVSLLLITALVQLCRGYAGRALNLAGVEIPRLAGYLWERGWGSGIGRWPLAPASAFVKRETRDPLFAETGIRSATSERINVHGTPTTGSDTGPQLEIRRWLVLRVWRTVRSFGAPVFHAPVVSRARRKMLTVEDDSELVPLLSRAKV